MRKLETCVTLSFALARICQRAAANDFLALGHDLRDPGGIDNYRPRLIGSADNAAISGWISNFESDWKGELISGCAQAFDINSAGDFPFCNWPAIEILLQVIAHGIPSDHALVQQVDLVGVKRNKRVDILTRYGIGFSFSDRCDRV